MPVIAALLFEFCLREMRQRTANRADRTLGALRWLRPAERFRVQLCMAADQQVTARKLPAGSGSMPQPGDCTTSACCSALTSRQPAPAWPLPAGSGGPNVARTGS